MEKYEELAQLILESRNTVVLTGAGISTDSGIPDFRGPKGLYREIDPMEELSKEVLLYDPERFYNIGFRMLTSIAQAHPNKAHYILAQWEQKGLVKGIITQNIDGLHSKAESKNVIEVHGNLREGSCTGCGHWVDFWYIKDLVDNDIIPPLCEKCGSILRPSVILFGDMVTEFERAYDMAEQSDLMIVLGSSLEVAPVSLLPQFSKKLAIINLGRTTYSHRADICIDENIGQALENINRLLKEAGR